VIPRRYAGPPGDRPIRLDLWLKDNPLENMPTAHSTGLDAYDRDDLTVIIETLKGSQNKYAYEPPFGFVPKGVLPAGAVLRFDFGFVPSTLGEGGDPLDILVLMDSSAFAGCIVPCRAVPCRAARRD
jgi:inorganic pyrophosphatase